MTMKITVDNFIDEYDSYKHLLTDEQIETYNKCVKFAEFANESKVLTETIQMFCDGVNGLIAKAEGNGKPKAEPKPRKEPKPKAEPKPKREPKPKKEPKQKKVYNTKQVENVMPEVKLIARYVTLHGKSLSDKRETARKILAALQKDIVAKVIRKTSPYATEIMNMQTSLISCLRTFGDAKIEIDNIEHYREIAKSEYISSETAIAKSFIAIQGRTNVKDKAKALFAKASNFDSSIINAIKKSLDDYISGKTDTPTVSAQTLQGLYGLAGIDTSLPKSGTTVNSTDLLAAQFNPMHFTGNWKRLIGNPTEPFRIMIYGKPGCGKSTLSLKLAHYLAAEHNHRVLYITKEEGFGYTMQEKLVRLNAVHPNLSLCDRMIPDLSRFDTVFIDSVNSLCLSPEKLQKLPKFTSFVYVFQSTKDGHFRGSQEFEHDADTVIEVSDGVATTGKNRFGTSGTIRVF